MTVTLRTLALCVATSATLAAAVGAFSAVATSSQARGRSQSRSGASRAVDVRDKAAIRVLRAADVDLAVANEISEETKADVQQVAAAIGELKEVERGIEQQQHKTCTAVAQYAFEC